jgi:hypothetical protein
MPSIRRGAISMLLGLLLTACGAGANPADTLPVTSPTPDLCAPEHLAAQVEQIHQLTRAFDDASQLAVNTPLGNLAAPVAELQATQSAAAALIVPACLEPLHNSQLAYMKRTVDVLMAFMQGALDVNSLGRGLTEARALHDQYNRELAAALGVPVPSSSLTP